MRWEKIKIINLATISESKEGITGRIEDYLKKRAGLISRYR